MGLPPEPPTHRGSHVSSMRPQIHELERAALEARQPMGRLVTADEVAHAIAYLASPRSGSTTGTILAVDGGMLGLRVPPRQRPGAPGAN